ncbi:MAG: tetratricopeptide repeat protein [Rhodospirillaceae bacterium]|jgi:tetratricopeptide (TPR) repeat protein|nr:tetratricopeptide repeat protein [Rhodospirillaceae bacterium]
MKLRTLLGGAVSFAVLFSATGGDLTVPTFSGGYAQAQEEKKPQKPRTVKVQAMKKPTFERLTAAQAAIELKDYATADIQLREGLADKKTNEYEKASMWMTYAYLFAEQENYNGAITAFQNAIGLSNPDEGIGLPPGQVISTKYNLGQLYMVVERYQDAINILEEWRREAETVTAGALVLLSNAYFQIEQYRTAIPLVIEAIDLELEPREPWYQLLLAAYFELEDYVAGADLLEVMVDLFPTKKTYFIQLAALYGELNRDDDSFAMLVMADRQGFLTEESELVRMARMYMFQETPIKAAGIINRGFKDKSVKRTPDHLEILANAYFNSREFGKAIPPLKEAADLSDKGKLSYRLGQAYLQDEKWADAEAALGKSLDKKGLTKDEEGMVWMLIGITQLERDRFTAARRSMRRATNYKNTKSDAEKWIRFLDQKIAFAGL